MDTKQLKQRILDLAIRGKLVPQDPNDEPASVLLERIRAENEQLIAQGKLKKSKTKSSDKLHYENVPFEIPETWEWCRLGEISNYGQTSHTDVNHIGKSDWILELEDIEKDSGRLIQKILRFERNISGVRNNFTKGTILYSKLRTYLNKVLVAPDNGYCTTEIIPFYCIGNINHFYIAHVLRSQYFIDYTELCCYGCKMPRLSTDDARKGFIPLPPLAEQQRIVAEVEKWFAIIDALEANKEDLKDYIKQVKSKVLSLAISGKLVPQDPNDEPAIELLKRINPNFKPCDTSHYENLPSGWCICLLEDIIDYEQPTQYIVESTDYDDEYKTPVLTAGKSFILGYTNESNGICNNLPTIIFDDFTTDSRLVDFPFKVKSSAMKILQVNKGINIQYVAYFMSITRLAGNTHKRYWISEYSKIPIPIPPKEEQDRIVQIISKIENKLDSISAEL